MPKQNKKPSYLGLLNAVAEGEAHGAEYLLAWAETTNDPEVAAVLRFVAVREHEHAAAFTKRIVELGYDLIAKADKAAHRKVMRIAKSSISDAEKFERFRLHEVPDGPDVFAGFFANKDIDPVTGGLLGRYIAEERDSLRRFAACYRSLQRRGAAGVSAA